MRIVHVIPFFDPATRFGGPVSQLRGLCRLFAQRGHDISVVTTDLGQSPNWPRDQWIERDGYRVWYARTKFHHRIAPYYCPNIRRPLCEALGNADVLHMTLGLTLVNAIARKIALSKRVPYIYTPQGSICPERMKQRAFSKYFFLRLFERKVIRDAAGLQALTKKETKDLLLQGADREKITIVPNGVDIQTQINRESGMAYRRQLGIADDALVVLYLGQLLRIKGLDILILAVAAARKKGRPLHLLVVGPDVNARQSSLALIKKLKLDASVTFTGHADGRVKTDSFLAADVFALLSYSEGLPIAVLEAASYRLPLFISEQCNIPEVEEFHAGMIVPTVLSRAGDALYHMTGEIESLNQFGGNAAKMIHERFVFDLIADQLAALYESAISVGSKSR